VPFIIENFIFSEVFIITPKIFKDNRGYFEETFKKSDFEKHKINTQFVQENRSMSKKGVIRGLHYQIQPRAQDKLVWVVKGKVLDVIVDVRKTSPTFKQWASMVLDEFESRMLYIPKGFAHGFCALTDEVHLVYKCTNEYDPKTERGIIWNDPDLKITWPINNPIISEKDLELPLLKDATLFD
jgi:dTDP-4-dehydrorhamnose 3,5-epimerase